MKVHRLLLHSIFTILCSLIVIPAIAQVPKIKSLKVDKQSSKLQITCLEQSLNGFLWLGSNQGLLKFDGLKYTKIAAGDSVSAVSVVHIFDNHLFIGFENGTVSEIDIANEKLLSVVHPTTSRITDILKDQGQQLWIATYGDGVWMIHNKDTSHFNVSSGLSDDISYSLANIPAKPEILVGTDNGITIIEPQGADYNLRIISAENGLPDNLVTAILPVNNGNFVIGTQNGTVCNYNIDSNTFNFYRAFEGFSGSGINDMCAVGTEIWIATESHGILNCNWPATDDLQQYRVAEELFGHPVMNILSDQEGNILVAAGLPELLLVDTRLCFITTHEGIDFRNVNAIFCNREGNIWFSNSTGLFEHSANFISRNLVKQAISELDKKDISIISIYEDADGNTWFGTFDKGVGRIDEATGKVTWFTEKDGLVNNNVLSICGKGRQLWFATLGGVSFLSDLNQTTFINYDASSPLGSSYIYCVFADTKERVWFGTDGKGPVYFDGDQFHVLKDQVDSISKSVVSITEDRAGNIWFYGSDKILSFYDGTKIHRQEILNEDNEVEVFAIHGDDLGSLVLFTSDGIAILDPITREITFVEKNATYTSNYLNTISKDPQGQFWIGSEESLIRLREIVPGKINKPRTTITKVLSFLEPVDTTGKLVFGANQNHIAFEFCGLWFRDPEKVNFQYKLEGYSLEWTGTKDNMVIFPQLPPGNYTFKVRSSVSSGFDNTVEDSISFVVREPFWKRWWFILGILALLFTILGLIYRVRLNAFRKLESIERERIQSQFETLKNQINPHFLFNSLNTLISLISKEKDLAINYVETLSDYFRTILQQQDKDVIMVEEELQLVRNYLFLQQKRFGENLQLNISLPASVMKTSIPPLTLQILAENAIKHNIISKSKPLLINIGFDGNFIVVTNNLQEKITREESTGIGLRNIVNRYAILFNKQIVMIKGDKEYTVKLPVISPLQ